MCILSVGLPGLASRQLSFENATPLFSEAGPAKGKIAHRRNRQRGHLPRSFPHYMYLRLDLLQHNAACDHCHLRYLEDHQELDQGRLCNNTDPKSVVGQILASYLRIPKTQKLSTP